MWLVSLAQVWTHYKIGKLNMWTLFYNLCINFLKYQIWKEIMFEFVMRPYANAYNHHYHYTNNT
jgi:hypothetical protein